MQPTDITSSPSVADPTHPIQINITGATPSYFETFGLPMLAGPSFRLDEYVETAPTRVVLSAHLWRSVFHADPQIVGGQIHLSRGLQMVVGIAAPEISEVDPADAWWNYVSGEKNVSHIFSGFMRIRPGASADAVQDELTRVAAQLGGEFPVFNANHVFVARPLVDSIVGDLKPTRHTLYRHFPDERALSLACSGLFFERNPLPDVQAWRDIADREQRVRHALKQLYDYYERNADGMAPIVRDAETHALTREFAELRMGPVFARMIEVLAEPFRARGERRRRLRRRPGASC